MNGTILNNDTTPVINVTLLEELDANDYLVFKKESEDGPEVKGGNMDALIIHATKVQKNSDGKSYIFFQVFFLINFSSNFDVNDYLTTK